MQKKTKRVKDVDVLNIVFGQGHQIVVNVVDRVIKSLLAYLYVFR